MIIVTKIKSKNNGKIHVRHIKETEVKYGI